MPITGVLAEAAGKIVGNIMGGLDNLITSDEERGKIKNEIQKTVQDGMNLAMSLQAEIILSETKGNWLQRSWRPLLALAFGFIVIATYFIFPVVNLWVKSADLHQLIQDLKDNEGFWFLMQLMIGGYVVSRGAEKIFSSEDGKNKERVKGLFKRKNKSE